MPLFYLDASALAKRYKPEKATDVVDLVFSKGPGDRLGTSFLAAVELAGAAKRLKKNRVLKMLWLQRSSLV